ncbi:MAG: Choline-sulfatase [uncultured Rubrobacteraceae bacterium]|uniref:Choline-sulfatase n=1 Tax=uncultured Rubrobacteraceae bacterium TaxID=349277 RepID=A0A6J4QGE8_9ACTN|nr:MAG: Choline-sulfatase [uncultured Rubrobacteraceae bacterium]
MTKLVDKPAATRRERNGILARVTLLGILASLAVICAAGCSGFETGAAASQGEETQAPAGGDKPNVVFVLADDLDYASAQQMPEIGSLLRDGGASFENASVSYPICCPSRATMLTGEYAHNHNVKGNKRPVGGFEKFREEGNEEGSIAARLQEEGYRTALIGKYLNGYGQGDQTYVPPGWDEWYAKLGRYEYYDYDLNENGEVVSYGSEEEDYLTDVLSEKATDFVRRAAADDAPFFAYVAPTAPHSPATPAERHKGTLSDEAAPRSPSYNEEDVSDKPSWIRDLTPITEEESSQIDDRYRERLEATLAVDEMVGSLVDELEAAGELDNTYIVFTSDNGYHLGTHRLKHGKKTPYEEAAHVPLFVRGPGVPAGSTVENLVLNTDLAATFAQIGGVKGFETDGRSLAPLMRGEEPPAWRSAVLLEAFLDGKSAGNGGDGEGDQGSRTDQTAFQAVRTETHKYVEYENGEKELYDLANDPYELENVYETADPALVEDLKARLEALRECSGYGCHEAEDAP